MAIHKITCENCGRERETRYKNTKYCLVCRLLKNLNYIGTRRQKCPSCGETFAPLHRNEVMCGKCNPKFAVGKPRGVCGFCEEEKDLILDSVRVCHPCATDPDNRERFLVALVQKVNDAKKEFLVE